MADSQRGPIVSLVPNSGLQFIDCQFDAGTLPSRDLAFWEEAISNVPDENGKLPVVLRCLEPDAEGELFDPATGQHPPPDDIYKINRNKALEPFLEKWVPIPFFQVRARGTDGKYVYDRGPTNWARIWVGAISPQEGPVAPCHVVLLFDTEPRERVKDRAYLAPSPEASAEEQEFAFASEAGDNSWFLSEGWVDAWLTEMFRESLMARKGGRALRDSDFQHACEHWSRYLAFLAALDDARIIPRVKLIDVVSPHRRYEPINVDLVVDVGNSRTCGMLIEYNSNEKINTNDSYVLQLRNLMLPHAVFSQPFESRVEFARASFGRDIISRRSGRSNAFTWPSPVRVGPEAVALAAAAKGNKGLTGLSSPKRYLWAEQPMTQGWRYHGYGPDGITLQPPVGGPFMAYVTEEGDVLRQLRGRGQPAVRPKFSRSSMYTMLMTEVLIQALVQINSVETRSSRKNVEVPRQLRRLILTLPPAMPLAEQRILRKRAEGAVKLTWDIMGWTAEGEAAPKGRPPIEPQVVLNLDEASCTQFVFLYNEVTHRFQETAEPLFEIWGRRHGTPDPTLRIASIDIGGGTTDLMITSFGVEGGKQIVPTQNFREGFCMAGDDVLAAVIERAVLPAIAGRLKECGIAEADALLRESFGPDRGGQSELQRHLRRQFVGQILEPISLAMLHSYEREEEPVGELWRRNLGSFLAPGGIDPEVVGYLETPAHERARPGSKPFRLREVDIAADWGDIDAAVRRQLSEVLSDLCDVVYAYDCDFLLISGRPSRLPAVMDLVLAKLPVAADRIIAMHEYVVGSWYPFRDHSSRIADPKTTAAVGAMLYALAEGYLESFLMRASQLRMKSTARFIGEMEISGQIRKHKVWFSGVDLDKKTQGREQTCRIDFFAPIFVGFRQLPVERWNASPLYHLEFSNPDSAARLALPLRVTIERAAVEEGEEEAKREDFKVTQIEDATGSTLRNTDVRMRLQTLKSESGYWLDTGVLWGV